MHHQLSPHYKAYTKWPRRQRLTPNTGDCRTPASTKVPCGDGGFPKVFWPLPRRNGVIWPPSGRPLTWTAHQVAPCGPSMLICSHDC